MKVTCLNCGNEDCKKNNRDLCIDTDTGDNTFSYWIPPGVNK